MLEWTGERFLPWIKESTIAYEHLHRYAYAAALVKDKSVLDLACGEGYGSNLLASSASNVIGIDLDATVIRHATVKYRNSNLEFRSGPIDAVPIPEKHVFDSVVCFEAIEHIEDHESLLAEVKRLMKPEGLFIVSTPNKAIYHDQSPQENPFHLKELYFEEFRELLGRHFKNIRFLGQRIHPSSSIWPIGVAAANEFHEFVLGRGTNEFEFISSDRRVPMYFIAIASDSIADPAGAASVLIDESDGLLHEKDNERERQVADRESTIKSLNEAVKWREAQIEELREALKWTEDCAAELEKTAASQEQALAWRADQVNDLEKGKAYWETQSTLLTTQLQTTQRELAAAASTLEGIYASRGWKLLTGIRKIRAKLTGAAHRKPNDSSGV